MDQLNKKSITLDDFEIIRLLGKGEYGKVLLVQKKVTKQLYAMKILKKRLIQEKNQVNHTLSERSALERAKHPYIVQLHYAFHNAKNLYMVLEYCPGGEMYFHLNKFRRFPENRSKFYSACIILALQYLHSQQIVYRDLKPENIVIDLEGYPKLTDFGLCKENMSKNDLTRTVCGTPEYIAPEIILRQGHGLAVDWWSLGCIVYEMLVGQPPFYVEDRREIYKRIIQNRVNVPSGINPVAADLIGQLLVKDPRMRLGAGGGEDVMRHAWFADIDWKMLENRRIRPPFVPNINNPMDPAYFCDEFTFTPVGDSPGAMGSPGQPCSQTFKGFSYNGSNDSGVLELDMDI